MKCTVIIDKEHDEEIIVYAHEKTLIIEEIEKIATGEINEISGYCNNEIYKISPSEVMCFISEDDKVYAVMQTERLQVKLRLYQLEEILDGDFIKINQSCIANVRKIRKFEASFSGALKVTFMSGYTDYVSRRKMKTVKERLGVK